MMPMLKDLRLSSAPYRTVDEVRQALLQILQASDTRDGKVWGLQVTNATEQTMELRALMSAKNSGTAWDLRCDVREKLIHWLQQHYPESLPRARIEIGRPDQKTNRPLL